MADDKKVDDDEAEPLSSRDVELEPVSLRDIEMILAPGKAPPPLAKPETLADKMKRLEAARAKEGGASGPDAATRPDAPALKRVEEKKKAPAPPPRKAEAKSPADPAPRGSDASEPLLRETLERVTAELPPPQPKDSGLEDLRQLAASHPPPAKRVDAVDFDAVLRDDDVPPPPPPIPPDLSALAGTGETKVKPHPKAPLKKREPKKETEADAPPASERAPRSSAGSKRPPRSERPRTTGVPAKSIEPSRPSGSARPPVPPPAEASSSGGRTIMAVIGGVALLGVGYFLGKSNDPPAAQPGPAATVTVTVTVTASAPTPPPAVTVGAAVPTDEPTASASAPPAPTGTSTGASTALPTSTGAVATAVGTATSKPTASPGGEFDKASANAALSGAVGQAAACKKDGDPSGKAQVSVTFAPSGKVTIANVNGPPFAGTATGGCIAKAFRSASVPPFSGDPVTVTKTVSIP